ncbi:chemotaxis protein CheW [Gracilinema caldarium]|uniref:CheW protein n=1 Tax=Gracilinema caldarium (strain ATCC 51460 / DSM 7334 / H1) TaxID=744872 RepID=F8F092_GRAC1|nr:chemotaxis protein CheW [Gracilinema caldarium]AEJ18956.1 CheW protein [Gracilinema caldarium DSM 7334]
MAEQYLTFDIQNERYGILVSQVEVVLEMLPITRVPNSAPSILGVINHRGSVVPVLDLRPIFGITVQDTIMGTSIIIAEMKYANEEVPLGILADQVYEVISIPDEDIEAQPSIGKTIKESFISGIAKVQDQFVILFSLERILNVILKDQLILK